MASLRVTNGPLAGRQVKLEAELVIGREDADLTIDDAEMSRRHAVVRLVGGAVEVEDLGSSNGTFVDGKRIDAPTRVTGGVRIKVGTTVLDVEGVLPSPQATRATPIADPQVTRARRIADPQVTRARRIPDPQVTRARPIPDPQVTQARQSQPASAVGAPPAPGSQSPAVGSFSPPSRRRSRGLASRSWLPTVLSFGTLVIVAVALVIYFATR